MLTTQVLPAVSIYRYILAIFLLCFLCTPAIYAGNDSSDLFNTEPEKQINSSLTFQDLALIIWPNKKEPVKRGQEVEFIIRVTNQGNLANSNIQIVDYIPAGFQFIAASNEGWILEEENLVTKILPGILDAGASMETSIFLTVREEANGKDLVNEAEIVCSFDENGDPFEFKDLDSRPDKEKGNDSGGSYSDLIDCATDPTVIGDDNNINEDGFLGGDEDDHDPSWVHLLDLATVIYTDVEKPVAPLDLITFCVDVINQGNLTAVDTKISINIPDGLVYDGADPIWSQFSDNILQTVFSEGIEPGVTVTQCVTLKVTMDASLLTTIPYVEITSTNDILGNDMSLYDFDSTPDMDFTNDAGGNPFDLTDNETMGNGIGANDEDDHDPAALPVLDLAIRLKNIEPNKNALGQVVNFQATVFNQGSTTPKEFTIVNYLPIGLIFSPSDLNDGWYIEDDLIKYKYDQELLPGETDVINIFLEIGDQAEKMTVVNMVEIAQIMGDGLEDLSLKDIDSAADSSNENDKGNDLYSPEDDKIMESGRAGEDEDDHDQAFIFICEEIACHGHLNVSLNENCSVEITPDMILSPVIFPSEYYEIEILDEYNNVVSNVFDAHDIGKTFNVSVILPICNYNSCWGTITLEDKFAPVLVCNAGPFNVPCNGIDQIPLPTADENCSDYTILLLDEEEEQFECEEMTGRITRTYVAVDAAGNQSAFPCVQVINIVRPDLTMVTAPAPVFYSCNEEFPMDENGNPAPWVPSMTGSGSGVPILCQPGYGVGVDCLTGSGTGDGIYLIPGPQDLICNTYVSYEDTVLPTNTCTTKIMRRFSVREWWCGGEITTPYVQFIEIIDDEGPEITCPANLTVGTDYGCDADLVLPSIVPVDECGSETFVKIEIAGNATGFPGMLLDQNGGVVNLPIGENIVTYIAYDACYNSSSCSMTVTVEDSTQPVAVCEQNTVISLPSDGNTEVWAETFDDGSNDECSVDRFVVRRMSTECDTSDLNFGESVSFCCVDVGQEIMVVMRVYDYSGNWNECMVNVKIQDKVAPIITCPADLTTICTTPYDLNNLDLAFGEATVVDNCQTEDLIEIVTEDVSSCGVGTITRDFQIKDEFDNVISHCQQVITLLIDEPMTRDDIIWPLDVEMFDYCTLDQASPEDLPLDQGYPIVTEGVCDLVGFNYSDEVFSNIPGSDACVKVIRTWQVVNWCQTDEYGELVIWSHDQVLLIYNTIDPEISGACDLVVFTSNDINCSAVDISLTNSATDDCTPTEQLQWDWVIDTYNDGGLTANVTGSGSTMSAVIPVGIHTINWTVRDQCGNIDFCEQPLEVVNDKSPNAVCIYGLSAELVPMDLDGNGTPDAEMATIWASDFDASSFHPCGYEIDLSFSADIDDTFVSFGCNQLGVQEVELWVTDENGNTAKCVTFINITNNIEEVECTIMAEGTRVSGTIATDDDREIKDVVVNLAGSNLSDLTDEMGEYLFPDMPMGGSYTVSPTKNDDLLNGVTTLDLIHIQRHILGVDELDSPFQYVAADANKSGNITGIDLVEIRKAILGVSDNFRGNESWRFIEKNFIFIEGQNVLDQELVEQFEIPMLMEDEIADFVGVKIGDVNGSVVVNNLDGGNNLEARSNNSLLLTTEIVANTLNFKVANNTDLRGFQMSLKFDPSQLSIERIYAQTLDLDENMYAIDNENGTITISWNTAQVHSFDSNETLFSIESSELNNGNQIAISSGTLKPEAYNDNFEVQRISIENSSNEEVVFLKQNQPNPWASSTTIGFELDKAQTVSFNFRDTEGKLLKSLRQDANAGYNELVVKESDLNFSGVIYYEMQTENNRVVKKMIVLN